MNKKLLAMLLAVAMIASLAVVPAAAAEQFPDAAGNWAEDSIDRWADAGVVQGDNNGNVNPSQFLTRAELATMLVRLLGLSEKADAATFSDVAQGDWFADAILKCAAAKIMLGDGTGHANPNDPITREQAITMVGRALGVKPQSGHSLERFTDADKVSAYAEEYMTPLTAMGILAGVGDGSKVAPQDTIDRASALALLDKAIANYVTTPGEVKADNANAFVVVNVTDADAADVTVTGETAGVLVTTGNAADVKLKGLKAGTVKVDAPVDVNVDGASKLGSVEVNAPANVESKGVIGDIQLNDSNATSNVTEGAGTGTGTGTGSTGGGSYRPSPSRLKAVKDAEILFITTKDEYKEFFGEDAPEHDIRLPWLVVSYTRNTSGTVTFSIEKDGETVQFGTVADGVTDLKDTISAEFDAANENAYLSVHLYSQLETDHKGQTWLAQTDAKGSYVATVELDGDEAVSDAVVYVDKTALNTAIAAATEAAEAVVVDTDAANVDADKKWVTEAEKKAYQGAIAAAQTVADKADATQADVDKAVTDLAAATETFEAAQEAGTKTETPAPDDKALTAINVNKTAVTVTAGETDATVTVTTTPADTTDTVTVTSSDATVATATLANGTLTIEGKKAGTATVTLAGTTATSVTKTINVTVEAATPADKPLTAINVNKTAVTVTAGETDATVTVTTTPADTTDTVTVTSSDETVATATLANGTLTIEGKKAGTATVTLAGTTATSVTKTINVTVEAPLPNVVPANLGEEQNSAASSTLATGYTATATAGDGENTYNITVHADKLTAHKRSGQTDTENKCWIGVGLPQIDFNSNSLFVSKDPATPAADWTQVGGNQITLGGKNYSMTYTVLTADANPKTLYYKVIADTPAATEGDEGTPNPTGEPSVTYVVTYEADTLAGLEPAPAEKTDLSAKTVTISKDSTAVTTANVGDVLTAGIEGEDLTGHVAYQWSVGEEAIDGATEATFKVTAAQAGKTITVTITANNDDTDYEGAASADIDVAAMVSTIKYVPMTNNVYTAANSWSSLPKAPQSVDAFGSITIENNVVTGSLKYITGFTGFNDQHPEEQEGWYVPYMIEVPEDADKTKASLVAEKFEGGETNKEYYPIPSSEYLTDGGKTYISLLVGVNVNSVPRINIDWDGADGTAWSESGLVALTGLSTVEFEKPDAAEGTFVFANLTDSTYATGTSVTAKKVGYESYEVTVHADTLTIHASSDPSQTGTKYYIGVGLPQIDFTKNSLFVRANANDEWTQVGGNPITLDGKDYSMTYTNLTTEQGTANVTKTLYYKVTADVNGAANAAGDALQKYTVTYEVGTLNPAAAQ